MHVRQPYLFAFVTVLLVLVAPFSGGGAVWGAEEAVTRTAGMPDSWLVLYNTNNPDSLTWAMWYQEQWGVPAGHMLGLSTTTDEHLPDLATAQAEVITPVREFLANNPGIETITMGILLGYGMPGHYDSPELFPNTGGYSIADALQDMNDDCVAPVSQKDYNLDCPHMLGRIMPPNGRLTKNTGEDSDMASQRYMVARIDGPTLADAMELTNRAKALSCEGCTLYGDSVAYDYYDPAFPAGTTHEWFWLKEAVEAPALEDLPWVEFDMDGVDGEVIPEHDAFHISIYKLLGWDAADFAAVNPGNRVVAYHLNSFGAVTVRSTVNEGGLYVPNALAAGYAAGIGTTAEPGTAIGPFPDTLLSALREGWTLGEAYYLANPFNDFMWNLVGDPLLTLPNWFDELSPVPGDGDMNKDGIVNGLDIVLFANVITGQETDPTLIAVADLDGSGDIDDDDLFLFFGPILHNTYDPTILHGSGDANGDSRVNGEDIGGFIDAIFNGSVGDDEPLRIQFAPDMNQDGEFDMADLPLFIDKLLE